MATSTDKYQKIDTEDNDDDQLLHKFLYDDQTIEDLSTERDEHWIDTYHALLEKLDDLDES